MADLGYTHYGIAHNTTTPGRAGIIIFARCKFTYTTTVSETEFTNLGRILIADFGDFIMTSTYSPCLNLPLSNADSRQRYDNMLQKIAQGFEQEGKPHLMIRDFNVARSNDDIIAPFTREKNAASIGNFPSTTDTERKSLESLLEIGNLVDTWKVEHDSQPKTQAEKGQAGWDAY